MSTSDTAPHALHFKWIVSRLLMLITVSGLPHEWHCTKRLMYPSRWFASVSAVCAPFTMHCPPLLESNLVCAPSSHPKYFSVCVGGRASALATSTMFTTLVLIPFPRPSILAWIAGILYR